MIKKMTNEPIPALREECELGFAPEVGKQLRLGGKCVYDKSAREGDTALDCMGGEWPLEEQTLEVYIEG